MSVILYYVIFIFASTAFWAPTVCAFPNLWGLSHHDVHSASLPLKRGTLTQFFSTLSDDQHEGMVPQRAPSTLVLIATFFTAASNTL